MNSYFLENNICINAPQFSFLNWLNNVKSWKENFNNKCYAFSAKFIMLKKLYFEIKNLKFYFPLLFYYILFLIIFSKNIVLAWFVLYLFAFQASSFYLEIFFMFVFISRNLERVLIKCYFICWFSISFWKHSTENFWQRFLNC